ncbi:MAG: hypothetical protein ABJA02_10975 [Acidobacteriota bacterium]
MLDDKLIATLEEYVRQTRADQNRLMGQLREAENEVAMLRQEIAVLENNAAQTEQAIDHLIVSTGSRARPIGVRRSIAIDDEYEIGRTQARSIVSAERVQESPIKTSRNQGSSIAYFNNHRTIPSISANREAISQRFSDRTITQACTLLLREANGPLHVNELYNLLIAGGWKSKGHNPTISIAVSLNRNRRFRKVEPGTFDLVMREASQAAS